MTGEIFHDSNGFGISYCFVGMIMAAFDCRNTVTAQFRVEALTGH